MAAWFGAKAALFEAFCDALTMKAVRGSAVDRRQAGPLNGRG